MGYVGLYITMLFMLFIYEGIFEMLDRRDAF